MTISLALTYNCSNMVKTMYIHRLTLYQSFLLYLQSKPHSLLIVLNVRS